MAKKIPTGLWARGSRLVAMASKVALHEIGSRVKTWEDEKVKIESKVAMAQALVKTMSELKGASMKLGQLISMDLGEYLPDEVIKVLENLHHNASFMPFEQVKKILETELGAKAEQLEELSAEPFAAASIGQVHSARYQGQAVVVKIQYPDVAQSIPSDLKLLKLILKNFSFYQGKDVNLDPFLKEVEEVLIRETDYLYERDMLKTYRQRMSGSDYLVPNVFEELCSKQILTMEKMEGIKITDWISRSLLGERQTMAPKLINLFMEEFFIHGMVQTDPNPGNFLITKNNQLALLDFGAVKVYERQFIEGYKKVLVAAFNDNQDELLSISHELSFIDPREPAEVKEIYLRMMQTLAAPFRSDESFDFKDRNFFEESKNLSWELSRACRFSPPPKELLFLHRKLAGVFGLVKKLEVKVKLNTYRRMVENN